MLLNRRQLTALALSLSMGISLLLSGFTPLQQSWGSREKSDPYLIPLEGTTVNSNGVIKRSNGVWIVTAASSSEAVWLMDQANKYQKGKAHVALSMSPAGATRLSLEADLCGVVLLPGTDDTLKATYYGSEPNNFPLTGTVQTDGTLKLVANGSKTNLRYLNLHEENYYNVLVIEVPPSLQSVELKVDTAAVALRDLPLVKVTGESKGGEVRVKGGTISADCTFKDEDGWFYLEGGTVTGKLELSAVDGWLTVDADSMTGVSKLHAKDGWVTVNADTLKNADLSAEDGWVTVDAKRIENSTLTADEGWLTVDSQSVSSVKMLARDGWLTADVDRIAGNTTMDSAAGWLTVKLKTRPTNLQLNLHGYDVDSFVSGIQIPSNWTKLGNSSYRVGSGSPVLDLYGDRITLDLG